MRLILGFFTLFALQSAISETPGICSVSHVVTKQRYVMDRSKKEWRHEIYNETIQLEECCSGYRLEKRKPLLCTPICEPTCENSDCMGPDLCVCHPRHVMINNSSNTCFDVCESCVHGTCHSPEDLECSCFNGYQRDLNFPHICDPICNPTCINAVCTSPLICECFEGYKPHPDKTLDHMCVPHCDEDCVFGTCSEPGICECFQGYINDKDSPSICLPVCNSTCVNGDCYAPDMCKCRDGFEMQEWNPYVCLPVTPEVEGQSNSCKLKMPQAVKYDKDSDCFLIKEKISLSVGAHCGVIQSQSGPVCSQPSNCHRSECVLNFWCSTKRVGDSHGIHCSLEKEEFKPYSADINHVINSTEWTDVDLVVSSLQNFNSSVEMKENISKEWTLRPLSKGPVCGKVLFAVEISECEISIVTNHINSSLMLWMNVILICGFVLTVAAGVGGFLWARHRRLNDPLNYREGMLQGHYNNECYENNPAELVSDDDSDHYSDAPL